MFEVLAKILRTLEKPVAAKMNEFMEKVGVGGGGCNFRSKNFNADFVYYHQKILVTNFLGSLQ